MIKNLGDLIGRFWLSSTIAISSLCIVAIALDIEKLDIRLNQALTEPTLCQTELLY